MRSAGNLGYRVYLAEDCCYTYARKDLSGRIWAAEDVHALSLANMHGEYATVTTSSVILSGL